MNFDFNKKTWMEIYIKELQEKITHQSRVIEEIRKSDKELVKSAESFVKSDLYGKTWNENTAVWE